MSRPDEPEWLTQVPAQNRDEVTVNRVLSNLDSTLERLDDIKNRQYTAATEIYPFRRRFISARMLKELDLAVEKTALIKRYIKNIIG